MSDPCPLPLLADLGGAGELPLALLAARMTDGVVVLDARGRLRFCNAAFQHMLGRPDGELSGRPVTDLLEPLSRAAFLGHWQDRHRGVAEPYMARWLCVDGSVVATRIQPLALFGPGGAFNGSLAVVTDASEQQRVDAELATARAIIEKSSIVMYRARLEEGLPIEYVSGNVAYFGYPTDSLTSGTVGFADIVHADDLSRVLAVLNEHIAAGDREFTQHYRVRTGYGKTLWVEDRVHVREIAGRPGVHLEGIITDVSERHRGEARLRRALTQTISAIAATIDKPAICTRRATSAASRIWRARSAGGSGLVPDCQEGLYLGALVHDVGKLAIPVDILTRPGSPVRRGVRTGQDPRPCRGRRAA